MEGRPHRSTAPSARDSSSRYHDGQLNRGLLEPEPRRLLNHAKGKPTTATMGSAKMHPTKISIGAHPRLTLKSARHDSWTRLRTEQRIAPNTQAAPHRRT